MIRTDPVQLVERACRSVSEIQDPLERAVAATALATAVASAKDEIRQIRVDAVGVLHRERGMTYRDIADHLGVTPGRVAQLVKDWRVPDRPGRIETDARIAAAEMRGAGRSDVEIVTRLVPQIVSSPGSQWLDANTIAAMLDVRASLVREPLKSARRAGG